MSMEFQFKHVEGPGGTFESICMQCLLTVGITSSKAELASTEKKHHCKVTGRERNSFEVPVRKSGTDGSSRQHVERQVKKRASQDLSPRGS
jgi:hypothetical protein